MKGKELGGTATNTLIRRALDATAFRIIWKKVVDSILIMRRVNIKDAFILEKIEKRENKFNTFING